MERHLTAILAADVVWENRSLHAAGSELVNYAKHDSDLASLRSDPRFQKLIEETDRW